MTRVLLTGATGFLGRHVVQKLLTQKHEVFAFVRPTSHSDQLLQQGVDLRVGDLSDRISLQVALNGVDVLLNISWYPASRTCNSSFVAD